MKFFAKYHRFNLTICEPHVFPQICQRIKNGWKLIRDEYGAMGPYAIYGDQWVSFDDQAMIRHKSEFVYHNKLGGAMIWALDLDDFR